MDIATFINDIANTTNISYQSDWITEPPTFDDYIGSGNYIFPVKLTPKQYDAVVSVVGTDPKMIFSPKRKKSLGVLVVGKGGGKDWLISKVMGWVHCVLLHLRNPQKFLDIQGNLDILNVATNREQAEQVYFPYFIETIKTNKWLLANFKVYDGGKCINPSVKEYYDLIEISSNKVIAKNKRVRCFSMTSSNESWEGYNVIFFVLDEISGFVSESEVSNGWKIFNTARSSCISRVTENYKGVGYVFSYPRQEKNDIILELFRDSRRSPGKEYIYGAFAFSWEFRPYPQTGTFHFSNKRFNRFFGYDDDKDVGIEIPLELKEEFDRDPEGSLTKYCCLPPRQAGDWLEYPERIPACIDHNQQPLFLTEDYVVHEEVNGTHYDFLAKRIVACTEKDREILKNNAYVAWLDSAWKACDAVIAIGRKETISIPLKGGGEQILEICRVVDIINWTPKPGLMVDLKNIEKMLTEDIKRYINLIEVGADRFESASLSIGLIRHGIKPLLIDLGETHYDVLKMELYKGTIRIFDEEKYINKSDNELTALDQIMSLKSGPLGPKRRGEIKKDKADAFCGVVNMILGNLFNKQNRPKAQKNYRLPDVIMYQGDKGLPSSGGMGGEIAAGQGLPGVLKF